MNSKTEKDISVLLPKNSSSETNYTGKKYCCKILDETCLRMTEKKDFLYWPYLGFVTIC